MYHQEPCRLAISCMAGNSRVTPCGLKVKTPTPPSIFKFDNTAWDAATFNIYGGRHGSLQERYIR